MRPVFVLVSLTSGADLTVALMDRLKSLRVVDVEGIESDTLELDIDDRDGRIELPATGEHLRLYLGYAGRNIATMGDFVVDEIGVSGPPRALTISAKGADMAGGIKAPRNDVTHGATVDDLVRKIGARNGLTTSVHPSVAAIRVPHLDQVGESDMALLTRVADQNDLTLKIDARSITLRPHAGKLLAEEGRGGLAASIQVARIRGNASTRYEWRGTSRTKYGAVRASYYDRDRAIRVPVTVGSTDSGPTLELRHDARDAEEAARLAAARSDQLARGTGKLTLTLPGRPDLRSGMGLSVVGLRPGIDGAWVVERAEHTLDRRGYVTRLECTPPGGADDVEAAGRALDDLLGEEDSP